MRRRLPEAGVPELVAMRHRSCGALCLAIAAHVVDDPTKALIVRDMFLMTGDEPKAGRPILCGYCGERVVLSSLNDHGLEVDRGPDRRQSRLQRLVLRVAEWALPTPKAAP